MSNEKSNSEIMKKIIKVCSESLVTDKMSEGLMCECGKVSPDTKRDLWEPISRSDTYMIRNTLQSMLDCGFIKEEGEN